MDTWVWIVIAIIVIAAVAAVLYARNRRERDLAQRTEKAAELRTRGQEADLHAKEQAAEAARQQADAARARMEAERLEREARDRTTDAEEARRTAETHLADARRLDPASVDPIAADGTRRDVDSPPAQRVADDSPVADDRVTDREAGAGTVGDADVRRTDVTETRRTV